MSPGFPRDQLRTRYDVSSFFEDDWHAYSGERTLEVLHRYLSPESRGPRSLLNAGSGIYKLALSGWTEITLDLFTAPLTDGLSAVCGSVERLPFKARCFSAVVCVGEVLGYCDPAATLAEFSRVLVSKGMLIFDFGSSRSFRHLLKRSYGRAADIVIDQYNWTPEKVWIYDPRYIEALLSSLDFHVEAILGTHSWSSLARRFGVRQRKALSLEKAFKNTSILKTWADVKTIVAVKT